MPRYSRDLRPRPPVSTGSPLAAKFGSFGAQPETFHADGDEVIAVGHYVGTSKAGEAFQAHFVHSWTITDGLMTHNYQVADSATVERYIQRECPG